MALTDQQTNFVVSLAAQGCFFTNKYNFPVAAMVACGCLESKFGTSELYVSTNCPFNLQKPPNWQFPVCPVLLADTYKDREKTKKVTVQFCIAMDLGDAARLFCEWVANHPNIQGRNQLLAFRSSAKEFARRLPLVGFGVARLGGRSPGEDFADMVDIVSPAIPFELIGQN